MKETHYNVRECRARLIVCGKKKSFVYRIKMLISDDTKHVAQNFPVIEEVLLKKRWFHTSDGSIL